MTAIDFGCGLSPATGYSTCDITGYSHLDYHFDKREYRINSEDESIDEIRCRNVIHHVPDMRRLFTEFVRVLTPTGHVHIIDCKEEAFKVNVMLDIIYCRFVTKKYEVWFSWCFRDPVPEAILAGLFLESTWTEEEKQHWIFRRTA